MSISFEGVGQVCATFGGEGLTEGHVVKITDNGTVGPCAAGEAAGWKSAQARPEARAASCCC